MASGTRFFACSRTRRTASRGTRNTSAAAKRSVSSSMPAAPCCVVRIPAGFPWRSNAGRPSGRPVPVTAKSGRGLSTFPATNMRERAGAQSKPRDLRVTATRAWPTPRSASFDRSTAAGGFASGSRTWTNARPRFLSRATSTASFSFESLPNRTFKSVGVVLISCPGRRPRRNRGGRISRPSVESITRPEGSTTTPRTSRFDSLSRDWPPIVAWTFRTHLTETIAGAFCASRASSPGSPAASAAPPPSARERAAAERAGA